MALRWPLDFTQKTHTKGPFQYLQLLPRTFPDSLDCQIYLRLFMDRRHHCQTCQEPCVGRLIALLLTTNMVFCSQCGTQGQGRFCAECGAALSGSGDAPTSGSSAPTTGSSNPTSGSTSSSLAPATAGGGWARPPQPQESFTALIGSQGQLMPAFFHIASELFIALDQSIEPRGSRGIEANKMLEFRKMSGKSIPPYYETHILPIYCE